MSSRTGILSKNWWAGIILWLLTACTAHAQGFLFQRMVNQPALEENQVYDIVQDQSGFLWFGTYNGLFKYDGYTFTQIQSDPATGTPLPTAPVRDLYADRNNNLWISFFGKALARMDLRSGNMTFISQDGNPDIPNNEISRMIGDQDGNIWFLSNRGLHKYNAGKGTYQLFSKGRNGILSDTVTTGCALRDGRIIFGVYNQRNQILNTSTNTFTKVRSRIDSVQTDIIQSRKGNLYILSGGRFFYLNLKTGTEKLIFGNPNPLDKKSNFLGKCLIEDRDGKIWIGTEKGLYIYSPHNDQLSHYEHSELDPNSISDNVINCIFNDNSGNIWIGTGNGISRITPVLKQIRHIRYIPATPGTLKAKEVRSLSQQDDNTLWVGSSKEGLSAVDLTTFKNTPYPFDTPLNYSGSAPINTMKQIPGTDLLFMGTRAGNLIFDLERKRFSHDKYAKAFETIESYQVWSAWPVNKNTIWIGTKGQGLFEISYEAYARGNSSQWKKQIIPAGTSIWNIFTDSRGRTWLGTDRGLKLVRSHTGGRYSLKDYLPTPGQRNTLQGSNIFSIHEDKNGILWLGTTDGGLTRFDPKTERFLTYTVEDGLPSNVICAILEDDHGRLWISSLNGIFIFNPLTGRVERWYNSSDGLQSNHFNFKSALRLRDGRMAFAGANGINIFHPDSIGTNVLQPPLAITSFKTHYRERMQDFRGDSVIVLDYNDNTFSLEFASLDFTNPAKNQFSYRLQGLEKDWIDAGSRHYVAYTSLEPGEYVFMLKGSNSDGIESDKTLKVHIRILPPWYRTWWFYSLSASVVISLLTYIVYSVLRSKDQKRKRIKSELSALRAQLNPHFIFNSLSSLQHFITANEKTLALKYLSRFAMLMRMILENSKQETITLQEEIDFLHLYFYMEDIRLDHQVEFRLEIAPDLDPANELLPPMMLQPLVENAIIHGLVAHQPNGYIEVRFSRTADQLCCEVKDNGIGREKAKTNKAKSNIKKTSLGLSIITERLQMLNLAYPGRAELHISDLTHENGEAAGTSFLIKTPRQTVASGKAALAVNE